MINLNDVSESELHELRKMYTRDLETETQASVSVRRSWQIVVALIDWFLQIPKIDIPLSTSSVVVHPRKSGWASSGRRRMNDPK